MKLSDIKGERTFDVIADIIDPIAEIASDPEAAEFFSRKPVPEGMTAKQFMTKRIRSAVPALLKNHKASFVAILAAIKGVGVEEYKMGLDLVVLVKDCVELLTDDVFIALFSSAQTETASGSARVNTKEH